MQLSALPALVRAAFALVAFGFVAEYLLGNLGLHRESVHKPWSFVTYAIASRNIFEVITKFTQVCHKLFNIVVSLL